MYLQTRSMSDFETEKAEADFSKIRFFINYDVLNLFMLLKQFLFLYTQPDGIDYDDFIQNTPSA
jgi:hypothetical protein